MRHGNGEINAPLDWGVASEPELIKISQTPSKAEGRQVPVILSAR
jgi:hypothetical protein